MPAAGSSTNTVDNSMDWTSQLGGNHFFSFHVPVSKTVEPCGVSGQRHVLSGERKKKKAALYHIL